MAQTDRQTDTHTDGHGDSLTDPAQRAESVKIQKNLYESIEIWYRTLGCPHLQTFQDKLQNHNFLD